MRQWTSSRSQLHVFAYVTDGERRRSFDCNTQYLNNSAFGISAGSHIGIARSAAQPERVRLTAFDVAEFDGAGCALAHEAVEETSTGVGDECAERGDNAGARLRRRRRKHNHNLVIVDKHRFGRWDLYRRCECHIGKSSSADAIDVEAELRSRTIKSESTITPSAPTHHASCSGKNSANNSS
jgi:hypothetical protein